MNHEKPSQPFAEATGSLTRAMADALGLDECTFVVESRHDCDCCLTPEPGSRVFVAMSGGEASFYACEDCAMKRWRKEQKSENNEAQRTEAKCNDR